MQDGRYSDRKYLAKYDLSVELFERFGLKVNDVVPIRNVFIISSDKGNKVFKKIDYSIEELEFINSAIEYIKNKFSRVMSFEKTVDGEVYTLWNNEVYCVMNLIEGRECDYNNPVDVAIASKALGELHRASEGFKTDLAYKNLKGNTIEMFKRRYEEMGFFKNIAELHEYKTEFDDLFLNNVDYYMNEINKSIKLLETSPYYKLCGEEDKIALCHHDLAYHNILINNEEAYFIDFDYAIVDLKIHDLCNFMLKAIKHSAFDMEKVDIIINNYCMANTIDRKELEVLHALLTFPQDFYSISRDYYTKRKEWEEEVFVDRFKRKLDFKEDRDEFLAEFLKKYK